MMQSIATLARALASGMLLAIGLASAAYAAGSTSPWIDNEFTSVRLVAAQDGAGEASELRFGLEFRMAEHWKIYWRSPGDAGFPPQPNWSASKNVAAVDVAWPVPTRFSVLGLETLGYEDGVVFPLTVTPETAGDAVHLAAEVDYLTCSDICVPENVSLTLDLPADGGGITRHAHEINRYAALVPGDGRAHGLEIGAPSVVMSDAPRLLVEARSTAGMSFDEPDLYVEGPVALSFGKPAVTISGGGKTAVFDIPVYAPKSTEIALAGENLTLTLVDGLRSAEATLTTTVAAAPPTAGGGGLGLTILGLAFLGGLILNLMPCVLPVLAIKLASFLGKAGAERRAVRRGFLATSAGIVFAFMLLAGALSALKLGGMGIGWGIQFQQPLFLGFMAAVVTLFACNLWGWFDIRLPAFMGSLGGQPRTDENSLLSGHFMTGMLATLLATPCSAPFLGTAVGFALARGPLEIFAIFAALGVGLAAPYLLVAIRPSLATALPKPGPWMIVLRRILGLALAATAAWLLSVLMASVGLTITIITGGMLAAGAAALWLRRWKTHESSSALRAASALLLAGAIALPAFSPPQTRLSPPAASFDMIWRPFDRAAIAGIVTNGKSVYVDVTADWCLTCQVNKSVVMADGEVFERLSGEQVTAMVADWTLPNPDINDYLASYDRYGIPFNAVYGPGAPDGIILPELLTPGAVIQALDIAAKPSS